MSHRERLAEGVRRQMAVSVRTWGVKEVCDWAEWVGLGQYRKRFLHHCIGGDLLLELTDRNLRVRALGCMLKHGSPYVPGALFWRLCAQAQLADAIPCQLQGCCHHGRASSCQRKRLACSSSIAS